MKKYFAEFIGTFILVFFGCGSVIVNELYHQTLGLVGISLTFGITVISIIYTLGNISGAHINPVVTISLWLGKWMNKKDVVFYLIAQFAGAILASSFLKLLFPESESLGATNPSGSLVQSFLIEFVSSFVLMETVIGMAQTGTKETKSLAGIVIGLLVTALILFAGPISGGSFNPARSLGPALLSGNLSHVWIYISAPILGGVMSVILFKRVLNI